MGGYSFSRVLKKSSLIFKIPNFEVKWRAGKPFLLQDSFIKLAAIALNDSPPINGNPITGNVLKDKLLMHPRYVDDSIPHEIIKVRGWQNGRTLDVLLDEAYLCGGTECHIMNFKGVGANSDRPMVIHPTLWWKRISPYSDYGVWISRKCDPFNRYWGALGIKAARWEIKDNVLASMGIPFVENLQVNPMPKILNYQICKAEKISAMPIHLAQLVRPSTTNLRMSNIVVLSDRENEEYVDFRLFADIDSKVVNTQLMLAKQGKAIVSSGNIVTNRLLDGAFTDSENHALRKYSIRQSVRFASEVILTTISALTMNAVDPYLKLIEEKTGIRFTDAVVEGKCIDFNWKDCVPPVDMEVTWKKIDVGAISFGIPKLIARAFEQIP